MNNSWIVSKRWIFNISMQPKLSTLSSNYQRVTHLWGNVS
jgi:hypothetical protein